MRIKADQIATIPLPLPGFIQDVILTRIQNLPPFERAIIELLTVSEQGLPFRLLLEIIHEFVKGMEELHPKVLEQTLERLVHLDMIELREQDGERMVEIAHLWYREIFLPNLKEYRRKQHHHCLGVSLERYHIHKLSRALLKHFHTTLNMLNLTAKRMHTYGNLPINSDNVLYLKRRESIWIELSLLNQRLESTSCAVRGNEKLANIYLSHSYLSHQLNDTANANEKAHLADQIACEQHNTTLMAPCSDRKSEASSRPVFATRSRPSNQAGTPLC